MLVQWYHAHLAHAGKVRLEETISRHFYYPKLCGVVRQYVKNCAVCQQLTQQGPGYGDLPSCEAPEVPWDMVAVDLIGPWNITVAGQEQTFRALVMIDEMSGLAEIKCIVKKTAVHVGMRLRMNGKCRYPLPLSCIHINSGEFTGPGFQDVLRRYGIRISRQQSRTLIRSRAPQMQEEANTLVDAAVATCMQAIRSTVKHSLQVSPGSLAFHRDMLLNVPVEADVEPFLLLFCFRIKELTTDKSIKTTPVDERKLIRHCFGCQDFSQGFRQTIRANRRFFPSDGMCLA